MEIDDEENLLLGDIILTAQNLARENNLDKKGFRIVVNTGEEGVKR